MTNDDERWQVAATNLLHMVDGDRLELHVGAQDAQKVYGTDAPGLAYLSEIQHVLIWYLPNGVREELARQLRVDIGLQLLEHHANEEAAG